MSKTEIKEWFDLSVKEDVKDEEDTKRRVHSTIVA